MKHQYRVYWNAHKYVDTSDEPKPRRSLVTAETPEAARIFFEIIRDTHSRIGQYYVGMIHTVEEVKP